MRSAYVHIPFCLSKCRYCGFNSVPVGDVTVLESYCGALVAEISNERSTTANCQTLFFGGGTPSILALAQIGRILDALGRAARIDLSAELTIEANPETLTREKLQGLCGLGFNRLSLGVQSFDDRLLRLMGRPHDSAQAVTAYFLAREAGFTNIGLDLIFALPGQTILQWKTDLDRAIALRPEHISLYSLTYEPRTEFGILKAEGKLIPADDNLETDMYLAAIAAMQAAGYGHYEVSNFAKPGFRSQHNLNYWRCGDYRGFGAGAHSHEGNKRWANHTVPADYIAASQAGRALAGFEETLTRDQQLFEAVFLGLRMVEGIDIVAFKTQWGASPLARLPEVWEELERNGLLAATDKNVRLTERGLLLSDSVLAKLAP